MKYWRKMLLAVFALCLFAGMAVSAELAPQSICDPNCEDGLIFIGNNCYWWDSNPTEEEACEQPYWQLDGAIWDCDGDCGDLINLGWCDIIGQFEEEFERDGEVMRPWFLAWSESRRLVFVSFEDSNEIYIIDYDTNDIYFRSLMGVMPGEPNDTEFEVGDMEFDDERNLLFLVNHNGANRPYDGNTGEESEKDGHVYVFRLVTEGSKNPGFAYVTSFPVCIGECGEVEYEPFGIDLEDGMLYVAYDWDQRVGIFDVSGDPATCGKPGGFGEMVDWFWVDCHHPSMVAAQVDEEGTYAFTVSPNFFDCPDDWVKVKEGCSCCHHGCWVRKVYEKCGYSPDGRLHMEVIDGCGPKELCVDLNKIMPPEWFCEGELDLFGIDVNPCDCGCYEGVVYVTARIYSKNLPDCDDLVLPETEQRKGCCTRPWYWIGSCVIAIGYDTGTDGCGPLQLVPLSWKILPYGWFPADLVATQYVKDTWVDLEGPETVESGSEAVFEITYNFDQFDEDVLAPFTVNYDPTALTFVKALVNDGDNEVEVAPDNQTSEPGELVWADFPDDAVSVKLHFTGGTPGEDYVLMAKNGIIGGYHCFSVTGGVTPTPPESCCCDCNDDNVDVVNGEEGEADGNEYEGDAVYFQLTCSGDVTADPLVVRFFFEDCTGVDALTNLYVWDDTAKEWVAFTGTVAYITDQDPDWPEGANEEWDCALMVQIAGDSDFCDQFFALSGVTDEGEMNPGGGGGSEEPVTTSSSGCNVGFSAAALLFAVPLVSIFRKR